MAISDKAPENEITANRIVWYILSAITTVLLIAAAAWATSVNTHVSNVDERQSTLEQHMANIDGKLDILIQETRAASHPHPAH